MKNKKPFPNVLKGPEKESIDQPVSDGRLPNGRFEKGKWKGGPGRKPLAMERDYARATINACSLDDWRRIVDKAVKDAIAGNAVAREWLAHRIIGDHPLNLRDLAVRDWSGITPEAEIEEAIEVERNRQEASERSHEEFQRMRDQFSGNGHSPKKVVSVEGGPECTPEELRERLRQRKP